MYRCSWRTRANAETCSTRRKQHEQHLDQYGQLRVVQQTKPAGLQGSLQDVRPKFRWQLICNAAKNVQHES